MCVFSCLCVVCFFVFVCVHMSVCVCVCVWGGGGGVHVSPVRVKLLNKLHILYTSLFNMRVRSLRGA